MPRSRRMHGCDPVPLLERERELRAAGALLGRRRARSWAAAVHRGAARDGQVGADRARRGTRPRRGLCRAPRRRPRARARTRLGRRAVAVRAGRRALLRAERDELLSGSAAAGRCAVRRRVDTEGRAPTSALRDPARAVLAGRPVGRGGPLLLVVDDAHWADEPSLRLLLYLPGRIREQPIAVLVGARIGEPGEGDLLAQLRADPGDDGRGCSRSAPARRGASSSAAAAPTPTTRCCRRCFELTAGNPLQLRELVCGDRAPEPRRRGPGGRRRAGRALARALGAAPPRARSRRTRRRWRARSRCSRAASRCTSRRRSRTCAGARRWPPPMSSRAPTSCGRRSARFTHPLLRAAVYGGLRAASARGTHRARRAAAGAARCAGRAGGAHLLESVAGGRRRVVERCARPRDARSRRASRVGGALPERALREPPADRRARRRAGRARAAPRRRAGRPDARRAPRGGDRARRRAARGAPRCCSSSAARCTTPAGSRRVRRLRARAATSSGAPTRDELAVELEAGYLTSAMLLPEPRAGRPPPGRRDPRRRRAPRAARAERALAEQGADHAPVRGRAARRAPRDRARSCYAAGGCWRRTAPTSQALGHVAGSLSYCDDYAGGRDVLRPRTGRTRRSGWVDVGRRGLAAARAPAAVDRARSPDAVEDARAAVDIFARRAADVPAGGRVLPGPRAARAGRADAAEALLARGRRAAAAPPSASSPPGSTRRAARLAAHRGEHARRWRRSWRRASSLRGLLIVNPTCCHWRSEAGLAALRLGRHDDAAR